jgi:hypothetical protein
MGLALRPFSRRAPAVTAWEGVLTFGTRPITVAGPWPIFTAFPASHAYWMSNGSVFCRTSGVNRCYGCALLSESLGVTIVFVTRAEQEFTAS